MLVKDDGGEAAGPPAADPRQRPVLMQRLIHNLHSPSFRNLQTSSKEKHAPESLSLRFGGTHLGCPGTRLLARTRRR